jgi:hypothetical protein
MNQELMLFYEIKAKWSIRMQQNIWSIFEINEMTDGFNFNWSILNYEQGFNENWRSGTLKAAHLNLGDPQFWMPKDYGRRGMSNLTIDVIMIFYHPNLMSWISENPFNFRSGSSLLGHKRDTNMTQICT